jgi:S-DNA-T family DNA segregation ATPase FtsK/SpoIIIE
MKMLWRFVVSTSSAPVLRGSDERPRAPTTRMKPQRLVYSPTRSPRLNEMLGLVVLVAGSLLLLALVTYTPTDPSFNTVGGGALLKPAHNWTGVFGAYLSDALLQVFGAAVLLAPLVIMRTGVSWIRSRRVGSGAVKTTGLALWLVFAPAMIGLLSGHVLWRHAVPVEGIEGRVLADGMMRFVNFPGAVVICTLMVLLSLYLATTFALSSANEWFTSHFAFARNLRERYVARQQRRKDEEADKLIGAYESKRERAVAKARSRAEKAAGTVPVEAAANAESNAAVAARENSSLLASFFGWFSRRKRSAESSEFSDISHVPKQAWAGDGATVASVAAVAPVAQAPEIPQDLFSSYMRRSEEDNWVNSPERNVPPVPERIDLPEPPPAKVPTPIRAVAPVAPPMPSPMQPIADQNIAFGRRADADLKSVAISPKSIRGYKLPPSSLLYRSEEHAEAREEELLEEAKVLVEKCAEFGVDGNVTQINPGPVVTTFEFKPDSGVKYSRVTGLADDLCLAMAAESILIERMAGKSTVGIQVPNHDRETIWLRDVVECESFAQSKSKLAIALGKDINGRIVTADLAAMPHVLIAGSTGSGKSVAINAMIMSVLFKSTPEQVRMILVDPKRVELGMYEGIPHLFTPIITEAKLAANALRNAVREMERRLKLLAANHVRNIDQFNKLFEHGSEYLFEDVNQEPLPYIMIIIDELADLMMLDRANVEESITRLAQMARAVGIHLVLATQRPSVDVITGLIKANVPTRMSFRLATKIDSRTIIDSNGAESLLGRGDMLFLPPGTSRLQRIHAPFVTEKEISAVTEFWRAQGTAEYADGFLEAPKEDKAEGGSANDGEENDALFDEAVRLVFEFGKASTSLLQRRLRIGYGRAAHLIDMMERDGLVGPADGSKPREILKSPSYYAEVDAALR